LTDWAPIGCIKKRPARLVADKSEPRHRLGLAMGGDAGTSDGALAVTRKPAFRTLQVLNEPHEFALARGLVGKP
jgi:hypothetical protein